MATRTFTVTVVGGKYVIDGVSQATLTLAEGATYKFDQADSSNGSHPLRFSTTSDGTHGGGSEYTTGVTTNGTPGEAGAYTQITVAASAPTLYYYCANHPGMGGEANTVDADTWGVLTWGVNSWASDVITQSITGNEITSSQGDAVGYPEQGWGSDTYGYENWGSSGYAVEVSGVSFTAYVNADGVLSYPLTGWGRAEFGEEPYGDSDNPVVNITGQSITASQGTSTVTAEVNVGWSADAWGVENWGSSGLAVDVDGLDIGTVSVGQGGWGTVAYGNASWGMWTLTPADVVGLSGQAVTASQGTSSIVVDYVDTPTGLSFTASQGAISVNNGADMLVGLESQSVSASVGAITPADVVGLTGVEFNAYQNASGIVVDNVELVNVTGVSFTASVGAITPDAMTVSFAGVSFTGSVGAITPADVVGLTGVEFSANVGELYPVYFKDVDIESSAGYEDVDNPSSTTYTDVNIAA
tara:strand:- start:90 stop:1499 length:1410 start_codon:yes stop_codon:yes gene_type:complete